MFIYYLLLITGVIFIPSIQHFIPPLSYCLLADFCNHTYIPECGIHHNVTKRLFIDECDMFEYNCDYNKSFILTNYSDCFDPGCVTMPPYKSVRMGNYKFLRDHKRRIVFAPTVKTTFPMHLRKGKRRYTPKPGRRLRTTCRTCKPSTKKPSLKAALRSLKITKRTQPKTMKIETIILQKISVIKNGKMMYKIVKGTVPKAKSLRSDSEFME